MNPFASMTNYCWYFRSNLSQVRGLNLRLRRLLPKRTPGIQQCFFLSALTTLFWKAQVAGQPTFNGRATSPTSHDGNSKTAIRKPSLACSVTSRQKHHIAFKTICNLHFLKPFTVVLAT